MSTPTNRQVQKERQPGAKQNSPATKGQGTSARRAPTTPQSAQAGQKPAQKAAASTTEDLKAAGELEEKTKGSPEPRPANAAAAQRDERLQQRRAEIQARQQERRRELQTAASAAPKPASQPAARSTTPPAPKPRDPSVARRDERREQRRAEIQARQQARRLELQRAKRQALLIRYDLIIAPILLVGLVVFFVVTHQPLDAIISGAVVFVAAIALLAFATLMPTRATGPSRPNQQAEAPKDSPQNNAQPPAEQPEDQAASGE